MVDSDDLKMPPEGGTTYLRNAQYGSTTHAIVLQCIECSVRFVEVENFDLSFDWDLGGDAKERLAVFARVVGHTANDALVIEPLILNLRNRAHMDSRTNHGAALLQAL